MKKKHIVSGVVATSIACTAVLGGCTLVTPNTSYDMNQVVAEVNVAKALDGELKEYSSAVGTSTVIKRELITYFINVGYTYVQSYGYTYEATFNMLMDSLVENAIITQYATIQLLKYKVDGGESDALTKFTAFGEDEQDKKYEYLLGEDSEEVLRAKYSLMSSINTAIDTREKDIIDDDSSSNGSETRTTPTGVDTEQEDYYPKNADGTLNYNIYTGYDGYLLSQSGAYQDDPVEGTTKTTRIRAYKEFIDSLADSAYNLVGDTEDQRDVLSLNYIKYEYVNQLEQQVINKYYDLYEADREEQLKKGDYAYIQSVYDELFNYQSKNYADESNFSSALGSMSDTNLILYAPNTDEGETYGFVYNILLPFNAAQSAKLTELQALYADSDMEGGYKPEYYRARNDLLEQIRTTDQRSAWFNGETEYAYFSDGEAGKDYFGNSGYLFFENNVKNNDRYEPLERYYGKYAYNGRVSEKDGEYVLLPNKLSINDMLDEFIDYVNFATGDTVGIKQTWGTGYYDKLATNDDLFVKDDGKATDEINYANFIYTEGNFNFSNTKEDILVKNRLAHKALSAVNELQYAYTTDTGVLSQYLGYSVDAGETSYIKEFEYAAHKAINKGAGNFIVCAGDYGWHLIYVTYTFENGAQFTPHWENIGKEGYEGCFEDLFYEWIKSTDISDISTTRRTQIINEFKSDDTVTKYEKKYKDLLDMDKTASNSNTNSSSN